MPATTGSGWDPDRFATKLAAIFRACNLTPTTAARLAGISRSQVSRWKHGDHQPDYENIRRLTTALEDRYAGLHDDITELLTYAGYNQPPGQYSPAATATPARGFFVDLADPNEQKLWSLDADRRSKEAVVAFFRMINTPAGRDAIDNTFDEARSDDDVRRRA